MATFRFLHAADLHIDSPLRGLEADPDAPADRIRTATRAAYTNLVELALHDQVAFVLIAGDLFDGEWQDWRTGQFFARETARLTRAGIRVFCIRGNHDAASVVTAGSRCPMARACCPPTSPPRSASPSCNVCIHGMGFSARSVPENVVPRYPSPLAGHLNIGMLHTSATDHGTHETYAPCTVRATCRARLRLLGARPRAYAPGAGPQSVLDRVPRQHAGAAYPRDRTRRAQRSSPCRTARSWTSHITISTWSAGRCCRSISQAQPTKMRLCQGPRTRLDAALDAAGDRLLAARVVLLGATSGTSGAGARPGRNARQAAPRSWPARRQHLARKRPGAHPPRARHRRDASALRRRGTAGARTGQRQGSRFRRRKCSPTAPHCSIGPGCCATHWATTIPSFRPLQGPRRRNCSNARATCCWRGWQRARAFPP